MVITALGHAVASASCFNGVNMLHIEYHQPLAFIKSHQGTNKSVCTLIKHEKKDNCVSAVLGNINGLPRELEFAIKVIPFLPLNGRHHPATKELPGA